MFRALVERPIEPDLLGQDLLLEQGGQHDGPDAGALEERGVVRVRVLWRGRSHDRRAEIQPEIGRPEVDGHDGSSSEA